MGYSSFSPSNPTGLLWEWNGVDTSQFDAPFVVVATGGDPNTLSPTISLGTDPVSFQPGGVTLELGATGSSGSGTFFIVYPIIQPVPDSYEVRLRSDSIVTSGKYGWMLYGDLSNPAEPYGYLYAAQSTEATRMDGSTTVPSFTISPSPNFALAQGSRFHSVVQVEGRNELDYPRMGFWAEVHEASGSGPHLIFRNGFDSNDGHWNIGSLPPAGWSGKSGNRFGLAVTLDSFAAAPTWALSRIQIFELGL